MPDDQVIHLPFLSWNSRKDPMFGFLLGDAANAIHFWPGRGINQGILSAVSLACCLHERWHPGQELREADFSKHEAVMHMLQHRHKTRAWHAMVQKVDGNLKPVRELIADGLKAPYAPRDQLLDEFMKRYFRSKIRLRGRLLNLPSEDAIIDRLRTINDETLSTLVTSRPWETYISGGPEVELDMFYPQYATFTDEKTTANRIGSHPV